MMIHTIDPWLDLKPTAAERAKLLTLIDARVALRMPAPYLLGAAYTRGVRFHIDLDGGTPAEPANILEARLLDAHGTVLAQWDGAMLSHLPANAIVNDFAYNRFAPGPFGPCRYSLCRPAFSRCARGSRSSDARARSRLANRA